MSVVKYHLSRIATPSLYHTPLIVCSSFKTIEYPSNIDAVEIAALRVDWEIFNILMDDFKVLDLVTYFGDDPFPKSEDTQFYSDETKNGETKQAISDPSHVDGTEAAAVVGCKAQSVMGDKGGAGVGDIGSMGGSVYSLTSDINIKDAEVSGSGDNDVLEADMEEEDIIHVHLKPHEGNEGNSPFNVYPKQLVSRQHPT